MKYISKSLAETDKIAGDILSNLSNLQPPTSNILLLEGDLGSAKTTFVQFLAKHLGVKNHLTSPTFVLMKRYKTIHPIFKNLIHLDAYRLNSGADLLALGWPELISNPDNLIVLEWPERVADLFTGAEQKIKFKFIDDQTREITLI